MVIDVGAAIEGRFDDVEDEIAGVIAVCGDVPVKVIIESAVLAAEAIVACCEAAERAGAAFAKSSTGFHPACDASIEAVALMTATVDGRLGVKASGGIRTAEAAEAIIAAGATRLRAVIDPELSPAPWTGY